MALALLGMPLGKLPVEAVQRIVAGGHDVCEQAGVPIAGGHSIDSPEPIYGLVALGLIDPAKVKRNDRAQAGDVLILGKALGVGIMGAALKKGELKHKAYEQMIESATQLNTPGIQLSEMEGVHALTDVTGYGLLGHLLEICRGSKLAARLEFDAACRSCRRRATWSRRAMPPARPTATGRAAAGCGRTARGLARMAPEDTHRSADQRRAARRVRCRQRARRAGGLQAGGIQVRDANRHARRR